MTTFDFHAHFIPESCLDLQFPYHDRFSGGRHDPDEGRTWIDGRLRQIGTAADQSWMVADPSPLYVPNARIELLDSAGIDVQVISPPPYLTFYELDVSTAWQAVHRLNSELAEVVHSSDRLMGFCTVPLQDGALAARELEYAIRELGMSGVEVMTHVNGTDLDSLDLIPFWDAVAALDVPVFIHPHRPTDHARQSRQYLVNLIGNPVETATAAAHLIFGGVLDRHPRLRIVLSHGGGAMPALWHRWRHGSENIPESRTPRENFDSYLDNFYFDSVLHSDQAIHSLMQFCGLERMVIGTDMPYDMGVMTPMQLLESAGIVGDELAMIAEGSRVLGTKLLPA